MMIYTTPKAELLNVETDDIILASVVVEPEEPVDPCANGHNIVGNQCTRCGFKTEVESPDDDF